ncbi:TetR/AcrR family transcriptional regulator [Streptacidiphilus monticola]|jgi:AcrR family transcriptional regulator|uniref:TetR/AcrR family transcriptional regulator n=1 Tax=Streptacidiphilus monticola TaxID=2161674 RepID=A0ABW1G9C0_9ACTN
MHQSRGLRAARKLRTREALRDAALDLFVRQGYDATRIDEIAEAVEVSPRTFFRYFETKQDVLLSVVREASAVALAELERRPAAEPPLAALGAAADFAVRDVVRRLPAHAGVELYLRVLGLLYDHSGLATAHTRLLREHALAAAQVLARRQGVDPTRDLRPQVLAAAHTAALTEAHHAWHDAGRADLDALLAAIHAHLDALPQALTERWSADV